MVITKDRPHGPGRSIPMFIVVKCEDHSANIITHLNPLLNPQKVDHTVLQIQDNKFLSRNAFAIAVCSQSVIATNRVFMLACHTTGLSTTQVPQRGRANGWYTVILFVCDLCLWPHHLLINHSTTTNRKTMLKAFTREKAKFSQGSRATSY